ncbi:MAG TPA: hypothetical protein VGQ09_09505 [Chitinophagaceae bacterium]|nr:hypothetical protein [Chitinophagaceae bacterium]
MATKKIKPSKPKTAQPKTTPSQKKEPAKINKTASKRSSRGASQTILPGRWYVNAGIFLILLVATLILYSADLHLDFFRIDDQQYVVNNPWIKSFSSENIQHILTTPYFVNYSPLHLFSYMLDYAIGGSNPYVFHLSSNIWAGIVAGFVFLTALALTKRYIIAISASVLFVLHPAHVEAIAWISSRKDLVATAFALPSLIAYLYYRRGGRAATLWYIFSLLLFLLALAGKLSVATFPVVFLALDLFVEKRPLLRSLIDKIPYLIIAGILAIIVASAQPPTGSRPDPYVLLSALIQNFWLTTGFGEYVIYRVAPEHQGIGLEIVATLILILIFVAPFFLRKRFPLAAVLLYWILFAFIPTQVLSFAYPVTDRYLFFPSVAAVILISSMIITGVEKFLKKSFIPASGLLLIIAAVWARNTINYLQEWADPRSVWYAATNKSSDPQVYYNLGWNYMDKAARFGTKLRRAPLTKEQATEFAAKLWQNDSRLEPLLAEWEKGQHNGPMEKEFQKYLWKLAHEAYDHALSIKGNHIMPEFFFHRGMLFLDEGNLQGARQEFMNAVNETSRSAFTEGSQEVLVNCHYNLGILAWTEGNYNEAHKWMAMAEEEQNRFGGHWFPDVSTHRQRLEQIIKSLPSK